MDSHPPPNTEDGRAVKRRRSSKACFFCRSRKVKCDSAPPGPCSLCRATGVTCTFSEFDGRKMRTKRNQNLGLDAIPENQSTFVSSSNNSNSSNTPVNPGQQQHLVQPPPPPPPPQPPHDFVGGMSMSGTGHIPAYHHQQQHHHHHHQQPNQQHQQQYPPVPYPAVSHAESSHSTLLMPHFQPPLPSPHPIDIQNYFPPFDLQNANIDALRSPTLRDGLPSHHNHGDDPSGAPHDMVVDSDLLFGLAARLPVVQDIPDTTEENSPHDDNMGLNVHHTRRSSSPRQDLYNSHFNNNNNNNDNNNNNNTNDNNHIHDSYHRSDYGSDDDSKACRVTWFRPMGSTSIAPGLQRITLRLKRESHGPAITDSPSSHSDAGDPVDGDGMPAANILPHLLDLFFAHIHCQIPIFDKETLLRDVSKKTASSLLINSICAVAARFSTNSSVARKGLMRYEYGRPFADRAQALLCPMLSFPSIDAIASLVLLAYYEFGVDSESGVWMMTGMAVRMCQDIGLHTGAGEGPAEEQRRNRLTFWSVMLLDYQVCLGTGRKSTLRPEDVTMPFPADSDLPDRSPFRYAVKQCWLFFPLINLLNGDPDLPNLQERMATERKVYINAYHNLPSDMVWQVNNLRDKTRKGYGTIFLQLHLMFFAAVDLAHRSKDRYIGRLSRPRRGSTSSSAAALSSTAARTVGEILVLAEVIDPMTFIAAPFANQSLFVAGCAFAEEIHSYASSSQPPSRTQSPDPVGAAEKERSNTNTFPAPKNLTMTPIEPPNGNGKDKDNGSKSNGNGSNNNNNNNNNNRRSESPEIVSLPSPGPLSSSSRGDGSKAFLSSVAATNLEVIRQGLGKQAKYWKGVQWIENALAQRIEGIDEVDLSAVSEAVKSYTYVSDDGVYRRSRPRSRSSVSPSRV